MPRHCVVPGCKSNYLTTSEVISTFSFPKDVELKQKWINAIKRPDWQPTRCSSVCAVHFRENDFLPRLKNKMPRLVNGTIPSEFPNLYTIGIEIMNPLEKLIEEVKSRECLYNLTSPGYRRAAKTEEMWRDISLSLGVDVKACKKNWRRLRDRFRQEITKRNTSSTVDNKSHKPWKLYDQLSFLESAECKKITSSYVHSDRSDPITKKDDNSNENSYFEEIGFEEVEDASVNSNMEMESTDNCDVLSTSTPIQSAPVACFRRPDTMRNKVEIENLFKNFLNTAIESIKTSQPVKTPVAIFLESIGMQIDAENITPFKLLQFQQSVLDATYEAIKKE